MKNIVQPSEAGQIKDGQSQAKRTVLVQGGECPFCKKIVQQPWPQPVPVKIVRGLSSTVQKFKDSTQEI